VAWREAFGSSAALALDRAEARGVLAAPGVITVEPSLHSPASVWRASHFDELGSKPLDQGEAREHVALRGDVAGADAVAVAVTVADAVAVTALQPQCQACLARGCSATVAAPVATPVTSREKRRRRDELHAI
jgi:hypothetical protein